MFCGVVVTSNRKLFPAIINVLRKSSNTVFVQILQTQGILEDALASKVTSEDLRSSSVASERTKWSTGRDFGSSLKVATVRRFSQLRIADFQLRIDSSKVRAFGPHSIIWWCLRHHILTHNHLCSPYIPHIYYIAPHRPIHSLYSCIHFIYNPTQSYALLWLPYILTI